MTLFWHGDQGQICNVDWLANFLYLVDLLFKQAVICPHREKLLPSE
jgi:hypothetical protein